MHLSNEMKQKNMGRHAEQTEILCLLERGIHQDTVTAGMMEGRDCWPHLDV